MAASGENDNHIPYQNSDDDYFYNDDDPEEEVLIEEDEIDNQYPRKHDNFIVLKEANIRQLIEDNIAKVSGVLSIAKVEASILLLHYNWGVDKVHDAWFADEKEARQKAGLLEYLPDHDDDHGYNNIVCGICFEPYPRDRIKSTAYCGHLYCNDCWSSYIKISIADGPGCLLLKCAEPCCDAAVGEDMIDVFASEEEKNKYSGYFVRSFIEENKEIKWCPGGGCENAINFVVGGSENFNVSCLCSHTFCWNCTEEPHSPVDCETVMKWMQKNKSEAENVNYILAFTKPCPKCKKPIEKNQGCSLMTCRAPCKFQFCWLCLEPWKGHGYNSCNGYKKGDDEEKRRREKAKKYLMRYAHYFERWATNKKSMQKVAAELKQNMQGQQIEILSHIQGQPEGQLCFLTEAWRQIIECRRVLAWTYAYGYYLSSDKNDPKRSLFEYLQGQAESGLERLHDCAEKKVLPFLENLDPKEFMEFRKKLCGLTRVTRNYFDNLVTALQNGLSDVNSGHCSSTTTTTTHVSKKPRLME